ncbi:MAG: nucleobase:cation symporter-2 family protein [Steroidobacteraceae bacterium]
MTSGDDERDGVDTLLPARKIGLLSLQHVLVMYAGAVAVPLIVGRALMLSTADIALLISADLFACGIATLIQTLGLPGIGIRLPIMMGVTFASVAPMLAMIEAGKAAGAEGVATLSVIYGSVIAAGIFGLIIAPFISRLSRLFPPIVTGSVILVIGISLVKVGIDWAAGGRTTAPDYGAPHHLALALLVLVAVLALMKYSRGLIQNSAVLLGVAGGTLVASALGMTDFSVVGNEPWLRWVQPLRFGVPHFDIAASLSMSMVMIVVMVESFGMFLAVGSMVERPATRTDLARGLRADALGTLIGGLFNTFPYTSFSQNVGLIGVTGVRSRYVCAAGGVLMLLLGLSPKLAATIAAIPAFVLGGAGLVMFGMIAATGVRILSTVDFSGNRNNLTIVAVALGAGMIPLVADKFFQFAPAVLAPLLHSGILLATVTAVALNLFLNGWKAPASAAIHDTGLS